MLFLFNLFSSLFAVEYTNEGSPIGDETISLRKEDSFTVYFDQPYGILLIRDWKDSIIEYDVTNIKTGSKYKKNKFYSNQINSVLIGLYLHETVGKVKISTLYSANPSFSWAIFPKDCDIKYVQNVNDGKIQMQKSDIKNISAFCFYSSAKSPLRYLINYDFEASQNYKIDIIQPKSTETFPIHQNGAFDKVFQQPSLVKVSENLHGNLNFLEIIATSLVNGSSHQSDFREFINYDNITFIAINDYQVNSKKAKFIIFGILGAIVIIMSATCIVFRFRKKKYGKIEDKETPDSEGSILSRPPTPEHIQIEQFQSDSADGDDQFAINNNKDEFELDYEGYPQNDYNPSNVEYVAPKPVLLKTVLNEVNAKT